MNLSPEQIEAQYKEFTAYCDANFTNHVPNIEREHRWQGWLAARSAQPADDGDLAERIKDKPAPSPQPPAASPSPVPASQPVPFDTIDTVEFRKLTMAYAEAIQHGTVPQSSAAWAALVEHADTKFIIAALKGQKP